MPPSKFDANPMLCRRVRHASFSFILLVSSCSNDYYHAYAIIDFLANRFGFPNIVSPPLEFEVRGLLFLFSF